LSRISIIFECLADRKPGSCSWFTIKSGVPGSDVVSNIWGMPGIYVMQDPPDVSYEFKTKPKTAMKTRRHYLQAHAASARDLFFPVCLTALFLLCTNTIEGQETADETIEVFNPARWGNR
jgi:hypothetical protein